MKPERQSIGESTRQEAEQHEAFPSKDQLSIPEDALACRFSAVTKSAAVLIDEDAQLIHFKYCHVPRKFLASAQSWFSCPIGDVKGVHVFRHRGESLTIVTAVGKALIPDTATNYAQLHEKLDELVPYNKPGFSTDHPMMAMVCVAGALIGLFVGAFLTPRSASDTTLGLFVLTGTVLGVVGSFLLVFIGDRWLKMGLAQPIGYGMLGACVSLPAAKVLFGWNMVPTIALVAAVVVIGVVFGIVKQSRERRSSSSPPD